MEEVVIEKLVHGGQGIATLSDGRKVFVWGALPDEKVQVRITKNKKQYAEAIVDTVITPSPSRVEPLEESFLGTSPWQILSLDSENREKVAIVSELFDREHVQLPRFAIVTNEQRTQYRNKMEYSFWADDNGLQLALYNRGSHQKQTVSGSTLAMPSIDTAAQALLKELNALGIQGRQLKTVIIRCSQNGTCVAALFVKDENFPKLARPAELDGLMVYYSNPKSPASVATRLLHTDGATTLKDTINSVELAYAVNGFFQVNIPVFQQTLSTMQNYIDPKLPILDMYSGVGSIGLSLGHSDITLVELDPACVAMAQDNAQDRATVVHASTEKALDYITGGAQIIVDPPRSGLHINVVNKILDEQPKTLLYLSCNPATQARDIAILSQKYDISFFEAYNYFPMTPHIECLAVLIKK